MQLTTIRANALCPAVPGSGRHGCAYSPCAPSTSAPRLANSFTPAVRRQQVASSVGIPRRATRQLQVVHAGPGAPVTQKWWTKDNPPNMIKVTSVQHFIDVMAEAQDKLVVVEFYAKWCNACRTLFPKVCSLCGPDPNVLVLKVDWDENKDICTAMGIKVLPYFQFYRGPVGRIAQFPLSITKVQKLRDALQAFSGPRENGAPLPQLAEFPDTHPSRQLARLPKAGQAANNVVMHNKPSQLPRRQEQALQTA
ncbi:hypothetical protein WJX73_010825 [Symbiochloris irregularis]|uniref:Thioredoxin domain-containing protein n=1 Tax=Symbiochloris irregularis TaxID=706552 RepID=A0AAW1PCD2_9CHLO